MDIDFSKLAIFTNSYFGVLIVACAVVKSILFAFSAFKSE